jgi:predicted XRE-type DNA-binding protein
LRGSPQPLFALLCSKARNGRLEPLLTRWATLPATQSSRLQGECRRFDPVCAHTVNNALRRLGYSNQEMTGHGFRSMASTLLDEQGWHPDLIELQLAHAERNKVRAAYNRAQRLDERRKMMQAWSDYLDGLRAGANVVAGRLAQGGTSIPQGRAQCARKGIDPCPDGPTATRWEVADGYWPWSAGDPQSVRQGGVSRDLYCEARGLHLRRGWSQTEAARALKVPQPTVSKIVNGNIEKLSIEFLIKLMVRAGLPVSISGGRSVRGRRAAPHSAATA